MRIGIEAQRIFRKKKHGMDIYALELIRNLQKIDIENEYFIFVKPGEDRCLEETFNFKIVEVKGIGYAAWEQISLPLAARQYDLDLLHCTSNTAPLLTDIPTFLTLHDVIYLDQKYQGGSWYQRLCHLYRKVIVPFSFRKAKRVFTVSESEWNKIQRVLGRKSVGIVYNGVSPTFTLHTGKELSSARKQFNLPDNYLFFLGSKAPKKNMAGVLKAYHKYRSLVADPLPLVIAESEEAYVTALCDKLGLTGLERHLVLIGYVPHSNLPSIYAGAELFLYPSLSESFGIPIIEAMACGTPVITSNTTSMPEVAGDGALLVDPTNISEMAQCIVNILESNRLQNYMIKQGLKQSAKFNWEKTARKTLESYLTWLSVHAVKKKEVRVLA